jgi:hypothetical protein
MGQKNLGIFFPNILKQKVDFDLGSTFFSFGLMYNPRA